MGAAPQQIIDDSDLRRYRTEIPNMADDELDPYEMRLYVHYKRVCGQTGVCWESVETTAEKCKMSAGMVVKTRRRLDEKRYIKVEKGAKTNSTCNVRMVDRWGENMARYAFKRSPGERSVHAVNDSVHQVKQRSNVVKKEHIEENGGGIASTPNTPPPPSPKAAADDSDFISLNTTITALNATLPDPLTGIPDLTRQLMDKGVTAAVLATVIKACQAAGNPAGAFINYVKTGYVPRTRATPKPVTSPTSKPQYRPGADGEIEVWTGTGWGKAYGVGKEVLEQ